jgi:hypothetical protein
MSSIPRISLTDLNRSAATLQSAVTDHQLAFLTRHRKPAWAVLPVSVLYQLLRVADQTAGLLHQPDLLQLGVVLRTIQETALLNETRWLADGLAALADEVGHNP